MSWLNLHSHNLIWETDAICCRILLPRHVDKYHQSAALED